MEKLNLTEATVKALENKLLKESVNDKEVVAKKVFEEVGMMDPENPEFRMFEMNDSIILVDCVNGIDELATMVYDSYYNALMETGLIDDISSGMSYEDFVDLQSNHGMYTSWDNISETTYYQVQEILNSNFNK